MQSCWKKILLLGVFAGVPAAASINAEMEGMEVDSRDDGTFLVGGPTYFFDRMLGAGCPFRKRALESGKTALPLAVQPFLRVAELGPDGTFGLAEDG